MKKWVYAFVILVALAGGWYLVSGKGMEASKDAAEAPGPAMTAGIKGSENQGNLGQPGTGVVQQPGADGAEGSIIGANLALGLDGAVGKTHLVGYTGMTVYTKDGDSAAASTCYDVCAAKWPPYLVGAEDNLTQLKAGVTGKVDTIIRTDGGIQVTYNGKPLYFYASDKASSDTTGEGLGGVWHTVKP